MSRPILVTGAAGFAGSHLLDLLAGNSVPRSAYRRLASARPHATGAPLPVTWEAVDLLDRSPVVDAIARLKPATVYHCAGAAHVGPGVGTHGGDIRGERSRDPPPARRARSGRRGDARAHAELGAGLPAGDRAADRGPSARPHQPVRLEQARPGARRKPRSAGGAGHASRGRSTTSVPGRIRPSPRRDSPGRSRRSRRACSRPRSSSAISRRGAISPTSATPSVRTDDRRREAVRAGPYNVCSGRAVAIRDVLDMLVARARVPIRVHVDSSALPAERRAAAARGSVAGFARSWGGRR